MKLVLGNIDILVIEETEIDSTFQNHNITFLGTKNLPAKVEMPII